MAGKQRMNRKGAKSKPKTTPPKVSYFARAVQMCYYLDCAPEDVDLRRLPIETVKALRLDLLDMRRETPKSKWNDDWAELSAAIWDCQIEINRHNAFMKRQYSLPL